MVRSGRLVAALIAGVLFVSTCASTYSAEATEEPTTTTTSTPGDPSTTTTTAPGDTTTTTTPPPPSTTTTTVPDPPTEEPGDEPPGDADGTGEGDLVEADLDEPQPPGWFTSGMVFPVAGPAGYDQSFGACRDGCTRLHEGVDIFTYGWKGVPVVAAHDGTVTWANVGGELAGCAVIVEDASGWTTHYVHLNTDAPGTDIPSADCFAPGIEVGAEVPAGTLIGWVGDTGNAESTTPHIHFEINDPEGVPVDPWATLEASVHIEHRWIDAADLTEASTAMHRSDGPLAFVVHEDDLTLLADAPNGFSLLGAPLLVASSDNLDLLDSALDGLEPASIVLLTNTARPGLVDRLRTHSTLTETLEIPTLEIEAERDDVIDSGIVLNVSPASEEDDAEEEEIEEDHRFDAVDPRFLVTIAGTTSAKERAILAALEDEAPELVLLLSGRRSPTNLGASSWSYPGIDLRDVPGVWWPTADGWVQTDDTFDELASAIAYVSAGSLPDYTLAYLTSLSRAPAMPLWRDIQPTSTVNRSL